MKRLYPFILLLLFSGCAADEIQMVETPLKLTSVEKNENEVRSDLTLQWQSLDGNIRILTFAPIEDSNQYTVGVVYARCFLRR